MVSSIRNKTKSIFDVLRKSNSKKRTKRRSTRLSFILAMSMLSILIYSSMSLYLFSTTIGSMGVIKNIGTEIYWDELCTDSVTDIDWGIIEPGLQKNITIYVRNEGNVPIFIFLDTVNWEPPNASEYMRLSWDYLGQQIQPNDKIKVELSLNVSINIYELENFNFDIVINGMDQ